MRALLLVALTLAIPATIATHHAECVMTSSEHELDSGETPAGRFYVDNDPDPDWSILSTLWIYQEANGIDGLQRRDEFVDDTCGHLELGDEIIY